MSRPRTPIGTFGEIDFRTNPGGHVRARARVRDDDGQLRPVEATGSTRKAAERNLKEKLASRGTYSAGMGELSADTPLPTLVEVWLEDLELEDRIAIITRDLYERDMRTLVLPAFEHSDPPVLQRPVRRIRARSGVIGGGDTRPLPRSGGVSSSR